jgi:hypothetical protein
MSVACHATSHHLTCGGTTRRRQANGTRAGTVVHPQTVANPISLTDLDPIVSHPPAEAVVSFVAAVRNHRRSVHFMM